MQKNRLLLTLAICLRSVVILAQACTPQGDQITYGANNVWIGYVYSDPSFTNYMGFVNEGSPASPNFSQDFGGSYVNYPTNGCTFYSENFTIRYKLRKTFAAGNYEFMVSGDDRIRLSIDGGATWLINLWAFNGYLPASATVALDGTYDLVLEYLEGAHQNRVFFNVTESCTVSPPPFAYGTGTTWLGYVYKGINFDQYKGMVSEMTGTSLGFNQDFGGASVEYSTSDCPVTTDFFSVRYKLRHTFPANSYTFTVSGDDKYRLSLDGGATWVIDRWAFNVGNTSRLYTSNLSGTYDMVLEYYEKDGDNRIQFTSNNTVLLPVKLTAFSGRKSGNQVLLNWAIEGQTDPLSFEIERSYDGSSFQFVSEVSDSGNNRTHYSFIDALGSFDIVYYRIKIRDWQGGISYSKVIKVQNELNGISIYPTIVYDRTLYISTGSPLANPVVRVCDMTGRQLTERKPGNLSAGQVISLSLGEVQLQPGIYFVQLLCSGKLFKTEKIIIH